MRCRNENLEISCGIAADNEPLDADGTVTVSGGTVLAAGGSGGMGMSLAAAQSCVIFGGTTGMPDGNMQNGQPGAGGQPNGKEPPSGEEHPDGEERPAQGGFAGRSNKALPVLRRCPTPA